MDFEEQLFSGKKNKETTKKTPKNRRLAAALSKAPSSFISFFDRSQQQDEYILCPGIHSQLFYFILESYFLRQNWFPGITAPGSFFAY